MSVSEQMRLFYDNPVISWHEHTYGVNRGLERLDEERTDRSVAIMELLGVDKAVISRPIGTKRCLPGIFTAANNIIRDSIKRHPDKFYGIFWLK